jgi:hypothetical protein
VRERLSQISYVVLIQRLISSQYIDEGQLPNANGEFTLPPLYTAQPPADSTMQSPYSLTLDHCKIPRDQLIKLGLEDEDIEISATAHCDATQVFETQNCTEKDFIATQTEVDQSFDLDMEIRTSSQKDEIAVPRKLPETPSRPSFKSPLVDPPPFSSIMNSVAMSLPSRCEPSSQESASPQMKPLVDTNDKMSNDNGEGGGSPDSPSQNFFTQNMTQESLLEMEKWLLSSSQQEDPLPLENGSPQQNGDGDGDDVSNHNPVEMIRKEDDYHVSSDDEPTQIKHYPLSANPNFLHKEIPPEVSLVVLDPPPNGDDANQIHEGDVSQALEAGSPSHVLESCPTERVLIATVDEESQTQPQMGYTETMNGQQSHSVFIPDTLTSSWDSPPDIDIVVQVSPSTPSQNELIGQQFFKSFPGIGVFRATVSDFHRYCSALC